MVHKLLTLVGRWLPRLIPAGFVAVCALLFWSQNHSSLTRNGEFTLATDLDVARRYPPHIAGEPPWTYNEQDKSVYLEPASPRQTSRGVAARFVLHRTSGLCLAERGHRITFTAEYPEFGAASPFQRELSSQLHHEYYQQSLEFAAVDWSNVVDSFREPQHYYLNWEEAISLDLIHSSPRAVSLLESRYSYTGGAHGNTLVVGRCFVEQQQRVRELKLDDLFDPESDWSGKLIEYCLSDLRCQGSTSVQDDDLLGVTTNNFSTDDLASFTLSPAGFRFYFSPYHVGCYAEGVYVVQVPYHVVMDCILADSPARLFMTSGVGPDSMN